ncbi:T9SS type B sorting domain-containing protein [Allomuricauda sp. F6463D]|uniref:T9SS type B sorting domain-containing protein n=2 Tax=Allomuricauda sp. F6463D TaxID=2926409 RepID=UPI001FF23882|nr:T9SS type B sorting domain-containing protein [Muricauda sp. F6463D]MCK0160872.1 T9SS type B sorting domain-containing protein [Muricauda sp. F6463D]
MMVFLLKFFLGHKLGREFSAKKNQIFFCCTIVLFTLLVSQQATGQHVDTWLTADRAVNSPPLPSPGQLQLFTPLPPADGTPVTTWYDFIDFTEQDAVRHPLNPADYPLAPPAGFQHSFGAPPFLTPVGSVPGIPTLRRNVFNFNPAIEFDGSGNGQALHFRSDSRSETTIFIVFRAQGAGNSAETQRLLFGGDIETHHNSTTNLSLGVSDGNRFSVGRTWAGVGTYFQGGGIDLLGEPTVGVFVRDIDPLSFEEENLITKVNGLNDINTSRNHALAADDLYLYNRLGKHFNNNDSNANLTGDIAEILVADGSLDANSIQRVESYLAIKYGITLNTTGQLGSIVGNQGYNYLAADGTIIWNIDPTYQYDISGIGKDRYEDFDAGLPGTQGDLKLRYNFYQRISKSVNTEARVTISTNSNFTTDNLDNSRTSIDTGPSSFSYDHNYLLWGNDHASIALTNIELPISGGITERISREWRVQSTQTPGRTPISGVSIRMDLSSSGDLPNEACRIQLMIDRDGDGDFTTGPIDFVTATNVVGTDVFFDNVDFDHLDVFSIGLIEVPELDEPAEDDVVVCDEYELPPISGNNLTGNEAYFTQPDGNGTEYAPGDIIAYADYSPGDYPLTLYIYDETGTTPNCFDEKSFELTITANATADAGSDETICQGDDLDLALSTTVPTASGQDDLAWSSAGDGSFDDSTILTPVYTPGPNDIIAGNVVLTLEATSTNCGDAQDTMTLTITANATADAGSDETICQGDDLDLALSTTVPTASGQDDLAWSSAGDGSFDDSTILTPVYTPGPNDIIAGNVVLTLEATSTNCGDAQDTMTLTITANATAGDDSVIAICEGDILTDADLFAQLGGNPDIGGTWSPAFVGAGVYTYTVAAIAPCTTNATAQVTVTQQPNAGNDAVLYICQGDTITAADLFNALGGTPHNGGDWSPAPMGAGVYTYTIAADGNCSTSTMAQVTVIEENLGASVDPVYYCNENNLPSNSILVTFIDPSVNNNLLYALDSTDPNDFILSPNFNNINSGDHSLFIMRNNGCLFEYPFTIEDIEPLELSVSSSNINQIIANVTGGYTPYTYYFDNEDGTSFNTYTLNQSGSVAVRVVDDRGCEIIEIITSNYEDLHIPDFFTPNNDGQNDYWGPRNITRFPDIETYIFDRYGRKIQILGPTDEWNGEYESKPMPSGDYWYIVKLNDGSGREFVGHFTLYR